MHVPHVFAQPARDLVAGLAMPAGGRVLDVGTGTGETALQTIEALGPRNSIVGIDPSLEMLRLAQGKGLLRLVGGQVPGLPFPDSTFDGILANFVLSHLSDYTTGLLDMVRVLRGGGRLGVTVWGGPGKSQFARVWEETAETFVSKDRLSEATRRAIPWEEWFSEATHLREALQDAGLTSVDVQDREYRVSLTIADYLSIRETVVKGRFMRHTLGEVQWERFRERVADVFQSRFQDPIEYTNEVLLAVGTKQSTS
jgi:ubiquinone/menaquinone biosynthesis C-methylase UbiE